MYKPSKHVGVENEVGEDCILIVLNIKCYTVGLHAMHQSPLAVNQTERMRLDIKTGIALSYILL